MINGVVPQKIAIFRALQLGDLLCSVPAFRALRKALPDTKIILIGLPWVEEFVLRFNHYLDSWVEFPGYPGFPEQAPRVALFPDFLKDIQRMELDLTIQMQGSGGIANPLVELFGAKHTAGYYLPGQFRPDEDRYMFYPVHIPEVMRHVQLMEFLGCPSQGLELEYPILRQDREEYISRHQSLPLTPGEYICIHPGARFPDRRWPAERFAAVGDAIGRMGYQIILTGTAAEQHITRQVGSLMKHPVIDMAGRTTPGTIAILLSNARMLICNDTGVSHIAAALKTPSVVLFSASDPDRWAPLDTILHRAIRWASAAPAQRILDEVDSLLCDERDYVH